MKAGMSPPASVGKGASTRWRLFGVIALSGVVVLMVPACGGGDGGRFTLKEGTLTIGSDIPYVPFEFRQNGTLTGFDVELMNAVAKKLGLKPNYVDANFDTLFTALDDDRFDVVAAAVPAYAPKGSPAEEEASQRAELVAFTKPYYPSLQALTVNRARHPEIGSLADIRSDGGKVAVQRGTTGEFLAQSRLGKGRIVTFLKPPEMFDALRTGQVVGVVIDLAVSEDATPGHKGLRIVRQIDTGEEFAFCVNQDNTELLNRINSALDGLFRDGAYAKLYKQYFPGQKLPGYASKQRGAGGRG